MSLCYSHDSLYGPRQRRDTCDIEAFWAIPKRQVIVRNWAALEIEETML